MAYVALTMCERAKAFIRLGSFLSSYLERVGTEPDRLPANDPEDALLTGAVQDTLKHNPWFILPHVVLSLDAIARSLHAGDVEMFRLRYDHAIRSTGHSARVGVVMAGNVPLVGFHDFFCVLLAGHRFIGKLSSDDKFLLPALYQLMVRWCPELADHVAFEEGRLSAFDAVIATGSDNTFRYFDYYFGKYPHIIRKNRNSVAVLNGQESSGERKALGADIFSHFGRGCRNVSKLYLPDGYDPPSLYPHWDPFSYVMDHHRYRNNFDYHRSVFIMNNVHFFGDGPVILIHNPSCASPIAVVHFEYYRHIKEVNHTLRSDREKIQCIVASDPAISDRVPFGMAQQPSLFEFADSIDTMHFLSHLPS